MTPEIRGFRCGDEEPLWEMLESAFRAGDSYAVDPDIGRDAALDFWCAPGKTVFLAVTDRPVGTYYIRTNQPGGGAHVCNCGFVTAPLARGRSIGAAMLQHALMTGRAMGFRAMQFNFVLATNAGAIRLWERAGFDTVGRLPAAFRHPHEGYVDALVMHKSLLED